MQVKTIASLLQGAFIASLACTATAENPDKLLFGDTHLHTSYSFDAFLSENHSADPDTAYRWAKGLPVVHPYTRAKVQVETPLDFLVVSDHAEIMGVMKSIVEEKEEFSNLEGDIPLWADFTRWLSIQYIRYKVHMHEGGDVFDQAAMQEKAQNPDGDPVQDASNIMDKAALGDTSVVESKAWSDIVDAADRHNEPGKFTAFIGWEWSSIPTGANLHRVVMSPDNASVAKQYLPYGSDQSQYPEDLWRWLDETSASTGAEFIAIPHNSNISKGYMFPETTLSGSPITAAYARTRTQWEPVVEATQIKGDSETHPTLSPDDAFADFESYGFYMQASEERYRATPGDYVRSGLRRGLEIENKIGVNPYKFGVIGSTDSHTGLSSAEEDNFWGKFAHDSTPETKRARAIVGGTHANGWNMAASGLAAAWATDNTRQGIYSAFKRREVYATTGPRMSVRVFGGWDFETGTETAENFADVGYARGVPMGGDLTRGQGEQETLKLMIRAVKDPKHANLDRVQVIKGWLDSEGKSHEKVYDAAWSGERAVDASGQLAAVGDTVNRETATYTNDIGAEELSTVWFDPDFDAKQAAFYYVRVLQIPTPRHSLYDAVAARIDLPEEGPAVIQERAYTSPIWYTP